LGKRPAATSPPSHFVPPDQTEQLGRV